MTETSEGQRSTSAQATAEGAPGPSEAVLGPFTLREIVFGAGVALVFLGTLLPFVDGRVQYTTFWSSASLFFVGIGILLPIIALALLAGRRLGSPGLRVGSLSVDQFASVTAVLAATFFFLQTVTAFQVGPLVALIGSLAMLATTVVGPFLPTIRNDFADRPEVPAHLAARPITAARPRPPKPAKPASGSSAEPVPGTGSTGRTEHARVNPAAAAVRQNGAGLYGAGGAGVVGAGPAASGQSGLERDPSQEPASGESSGVTPAAQATGTGASAVRAGSPSDTDGAGASAAEAPDAASSHSTPVAGQETRVHDVVRDDPTREHGTSEQGEPSRQEPITATRSAEEEEPVVEAFWFAVGSPRPVFDEQTGREIFTLQPGDWEVGISDRGHEFLVQDKRTGAIGILRDLRNIERAPRD